MLATGAFMASGRVIRDTLGTMPPWIALLVVVVLVSFVVVSPDEEAL